MACKIQQEQEQHTKSMELSTILKQYAKSKDSSVNNDQHKQPMELFKVLKEQSLKQTDPKEQPNSRDYEYQEQHKYTRDLYE
eukprot:13265235-Ditylum_brightwellii.AAC.1